MALSNTGLPYYEKQALNALIRIFSNCKTCLSQMSDEQSKDHTL